MQVATRPRVNAGIALLGASVVVASTIAIRPPDVHLPTLPALASNASVQLVALENPLEVFGAILQKALIDAGTLGNQVLASPAPILSQIITNQLANASGLAGVSVSFISNVVNSLVNDVPKQIQLGLNQIANGQITAGLNSFVGTILVALAGPNLANLDLINQATSILKAPVQNVINVINVLPTVLLNAAIIPIQVLGNLANGVGDGIEGLMAAVSSGNLENVVNAAMNAAAGVISAMTNSIVDPNLGVIGAILNIRNIIAGALAPTAAVATAASIPDVAAKTVTLSLTKTPETATTPTATDTATKPEASAPAASTPSAPASTPASSETDATTGTPATGTATDGTATDGSTTDGATKTSTDPKTDPKSGSDTSGSGTTGSTTSGSTTKGDTGTKGDTTSKGDTGTKTGGDTTSKGGDTKGASNGTGATKKSGSEGAGDSAKHADAK